VVSPAAGAVGSCVGHLALGARIAICGTASIQEWDPLPVGPRVHRQLLVARARMSGLLVHDYADHFDEAVGNLTGWLDSGELVSREQVLDGIEQAPGAIGMLYRGENTGKLVIRLENARGPRSRPDCEFHYDDHDQNLKHVLRGRGVKIYPHHPLDLFRIRVFLTHLQMRPQTQRHQNSQPPDCEDRRDGERRDHPLHFGIPEIEIAHADGQIESRRWHYDPQSFHNER